MKKLFAVLLVASAAFSQTNVQLMNLEYCKSRSFAAPPNYSFYTGASLTQALVGEASDFNLNFGLAGKFVLNYVKVGGAHIVLYGNIAPSFSARDLTAFDAINFANDGIGIGISPYFILGDAVLKSLTVVTEAEAKNNDFGDGLSVWIYKLSGGLDGSLYVPEVGSALAVSAKASYVVTREDAFTKVQNEVEGNYWVFEANVVLPLKDKLGLLAQAQTTNVSNPVYRLGLILGTSL